MVYRSMQDCQRQENAMAWCRLSQWARVKARKLERQNDRLDEVIRAGEKLCQDLQARAIAREAATAAG